MNRNLMIAAGVASLLFATAACGGGSSGLSDGEVTIGYLANATGDASGPFGIPFDRGMQLALSEIDDKDFFGDSGASLNVVKKDTGSELNTAITEYNKFVNDDVALVLSDSMTPIAAGLAPLANEDGVLFLTGAGSKIENKNGFAFHLADLGTPMVTLGTHLAESGVTKVVAVVDGDNAAFQTMADSAEAGLKEGGGSGFAATESVAAGDTDFAALLTKIRAAKPDAVLLSVLPEQAGNILRQMSQFGGLENVKGVGTIAWSDQVFKVAEDAAVGTTFALPWAPGLPSSVTFEENYSEKYDSKPNAYSAIGYQTAWLLAAAVKDAAEKGEDIDSDTLKALLPSASTSQTVADNGVIAGFSLDKEGNPAYPGVLATFTADGAITAADTAK